MRFQFKLWILICLNVYLDILGLVHGLHIRSPCNFIDNPCLSRYCLIRCNFNSKNDDSYSLKNPVSKSNVLKAVKFDSLSNVLPKITYTNYTDHVFKRFNRKNVSQFSFITNRITDGFRTTTVQAHGVLPKENPRKRRKDRDKMANQKQRKLLGTPVYKNEMDKLIDMCAEIDRLYEKYQDMDIVHEKMGIKKPYDISDDTLVCLARNFLNRPAPPKDYFGKMIQELGFLMMYNNIKKMMKGFVKKVEGKISPREEEEFPRNYKYAFGIEPLSFGEEVEPLSEIAIRGFVQEKYYEHIERMAKYNPKRAQKILTVLHRIFKPPELRSEVDKDVDDAEVLEDSQKVFDIYAECIRKFIKDYPYLKWPTNDEEHLDLFRTWFDPTAERTMKLSYIIKDHFLDNFRSESNKVERYILNPGLGVFSGLVFGKGAELLTEYLYSKNPDLFELVHRYKKNFKYVFGVLTYLLTSDSSVEVDYFYEVLKVLYEDVKILEDKGPEYLMQHLSTSETTSTSDLFTRLFKGSSETFKNFGSERRNGGSLVDPNFQTKYGDEEYADLMRGIINFRKESLVRLADQNGVSYRDFRLAMEKASQVLTFHSYLRLLTMYRYGSLHESDPVVRKMPEYEEFSDDEDEGVKTGYQNRKTGYSFADDDVEIVPLPPPPKPSTEFMDPGRLDDMHKMITNLRYINEVCLPPSKTSVYRLMYHIGCYMAMMGNLPVAYGNEVLGYYISGEDFIENNMTPEDDYSTLYRTGEHESGLPPEDVKKNKYTALQLTSFFLQVFSNMENFVTCTSPRNFGIEFDTDIDLFRSMGVSEEQLEMFRKIPQMPSTMDEIEDWALKLNENGGYSEREKVVYKYGIIPKDEYLGETPEQIEVREKYELENMRCYFESLFQKSDRVVEIVQAMSMILHVSEKFMFENIPGYWLNYVANWIYKDLDNVNNNFDHYVKVFNMSDKAIEQVKQRVVEVHFEHLKNVEEKAKEGTTITTTNTDTYTNSNNTSSNKGNNSDRNSSSTDKTSTTTKSTSTSGDSSVSDVYKDINQDPFGLKRNAKDKDEKLKELFSGIKKVCNKLELGEDMLYDYYRVYTFYYLMDELRELDLTSVSKTDMEYIKKRYESTDIVFVNALCEVIKEKVNVVKKALVDSVGLEDFYLIEKNVQTLINMRRSLMRSLRNVIEPKYFYRIDRAMQHNKTYLIKDFTYSEMLGRDNVLGDGGFGETLRYVTLDDNTDTYTSINSDRNSSSTNKTSTTTKSTETGKKRVLTFGKRVASDVLKSLDGDWELVDDKIQLTHFEKEKLKSEREERKLLKPLPLYGLDTYEDFFQRSRIDDAIKKGELPEELRCIPNEFHIGKREVNTDYDLSLKIPEDKLKDRRAVIPSEKIFKAWVIYTYRKRRASTEDKEDFKAIFPASAKMVDDNVKDWRHLYVRNCIRNDDINSVRDWNQEIYPSEVYGQSKKNEEEVRKVLEYCYEEELLRATKGAMEEVEDDIGNVEDFYFCASYPSKNLRMDYVFSLELPSEEKLSYIEKVQKFLKISPKSLEYIHSRRFHYALGAHFRSILRQHEGATLKTLVNEYLKPISQRLMISKETYTNILTMSVHDHVVSILDQYFNKCSIGDAFLRHVDRFLLMCNRLELISNEGVSKFSASLDSQKLNLKIIDYFIISSLEVLNEVDVDKLDLLCDLLGIRGEMKKTELEALGRNLYYKHMMKHHKDNIYLETFDELKKVHHVYGFDENHFRKIIYDYRLLKMLEIYDAESGLDAFNKCLDIVMEDDFNKYLNLNKDSKTHWFMNIMTDLIDKKVFDISEYLQLVDSNYLSNIYDPFDMKSKTGSVDESRNVDITCDYVKESIHSDYEWADSITSLSNKCKNSREEFEKNNKGLIDFFYLLMDKLGLSHMQLMEALFHFAENNVHKYSERLRSALDENYNLEYEYIDKSEDPNLKGSKSPYVLLVDLLKVLSLTPKNSISHIKEKVGTFDIGPLRETLIEHSHSLEEQKRTLKLLDLYLVK